MNCLSELLLLDLLYVTRYFEEEVIMGEIVERTLDGANVEKNVDIYGRWWCGGEMTGDGILYNENNERLVRGAKFLKKIT